MSLSASINSETEKKQITEEKEPSLKQKLMLKRNTLKRS
jgi:hypothetical protein